MAILIPIAFRIKSGKDADRRYTPVICTFEHLVDSGFRESVAFVSESSPPYILEVSTDDWHTWKEIGILEDRRL